MPPERSEALTEHEQTAFSDLANVLHDYQRALGDLTNQYERQKFGLVQSIMRTENALKERGKEALIAHGIDLEEFEKGHWTIDTTTMALVYTGPS